MLTMKLSLEKKVPSIFITKIKYVFSKKIFSVGSGYNF